jgi:hypothetical protein
MMSDQKNLRSEKPDSSSPGWLFTGGGQIAREAMNEMKR